MTRDELIREVALRMDEVTPDNDVVVAVDGADNNPLYALISGLIEDATSELYKIAPYWRLPQSTVTQNASHITSAPIFSSTSYERTKIRIKIDDSFLRIASINHTSFSRPITEVYPEQSEEARSQHDRHLVAKTAKPVAVLTYGAWDSTTSKEIDCYSLGKDAVVTPTGVTAAFIAKPAVIAGTGANAVEAVVPTVLIPALEWLIASRAFGARGDTNHAAICQQYMQESLV